MKAHTCYYCNCYSTYGWDQVTQGLVQLGFLLMDSFGPKGMFGKPSDVEPTVHLTPTQKACALGAQILLATFKVILLYVSFICQLVLYVIILYYCPSIYTLYCIVFTFIS
jgi:Fanconi anemia group I protein